MEVMGLMLGEFVDDYTVRVVDVFAMPQSGTGVSVEAVDPVFQTKMLDMLKQCGRCVCTRVRVPCVPCVCACSRMCRREGREALRSVAGLPPCVA